MKSTALFILILSNSAFVFGFDCEETRKTILDKYMAVQTAIHNNHYNTKTSMEQTWYQDDQGKDKKPIKKNPKVLLATLERDFGTNGVTFPPNSFKGKVFNGEFNKEGEIVKKKDESGKNYGDIETLPFYPKELAVHLMQVDRNSNGPDWEKYAINESNYKITGPVCQAPKVGDPKKTTIYKFLFTPLPNRKGLMDGEFSIDQDGEPLLIQGKPTDSHTGLEAASFSQTYGKDEKGQTVIYQINVEMDMRLNVPGLSYLMASKASILSLTHVKATVIFGGPGKQIAVLRILDTSEGNGNSEVLENPQVPENPEVQGTK